MSPSFHSSVFKATDKVLLVTAHPDDEAMFFAPLILTLTSLGIPVYVLCLSNGDAYGLGHVREKELYAACATLQIPRDRITVINDADLQDGMQNLWTEDVVEKHVHAAMQRVAITQVVTFDRYGVSGHPNHISTHKGLRRYISKRKQASPGPLCWQLESIGLWRKYLGIANVPLSWLTLPQTSTLYCNPRPWTSFAALNQHRSQAVWYRQLFMIFSSYNYANVLTRMA